MRCWQSTGPEFSDRFAVRFSAPFNDRSALPRTARTTAGWLLLVLAVFACCARPAFAFHARSARVVHAWILIDAKTGQVLESYHPERQAHPASLTKLMTLYLTFRSLQSGHIALDTRLHVSRHAAAQQPTKLWLRPGSTITVHDAILGITTRSANDAAVVLGESLGGSEARFAGMMNREAHRLGMTHTAFYNASGLPNARQWTTARDMATLAVALIDTFPQYYSFFGERSFRFHGHTVYGHDHLLDECEGVDGMKTGYVRASGYNIVTSARRDGRRLVGVVLGGDSAEDRDRQMTALINLGFGQQPAPGLLVAGATHPAEPLPAHSVAKLVKASDDAVLPDGRDWVIELGADFRTQHSVRHVLHSARLTAASPLRHGHSIVVRLRGHRYRARFSHLSQEEAQRACTALEHRGFTCRILNHAPAQVQDVASAGSSSSAQSD